MADLFSELKRRNVFKVGVAYTALGWVVIQVTSVAVPALNLPEVLNTIVFYLGVIGFPFALFFAWAFELTPEGIKKTSDVGEQESITPSTGRKLDFMIIGLLALALLGVSYDSYLRPKPNNGGGTIENDPSIAVLAFQNMSSDPDQEHFSDGISEEILNLLAKTPGLRVAARTSSFAFKGRNEPIITIGQKLDVHHVLEGSVRRAGDKVRITAQLINASNGYHLWSETYDREFKDIFKIQDEIATAILDQMKVHLLGSGDLHQIANMSTSGRNYLETDNMKAYEAYLVGRQLISQRTEAQLIKARSELQKAVMLDPDFVPAQTQLMLAWILLENGWGTYGTESRKDVDENVTLLIDKIGKKADNYADFHAVVGLWNSNRNNPVPALKSLNKAIALNPNHVNAYHWRALNQTLLDASDTSIVNDSLKAHQLDPMSAVMAQSAVASFLEFDRLEDAKKIADTMLARLPNHRQSMTNFGMIYEAEGKLEQSLLWYLRATKFSNGYSVRRDTVKLYSALGLEIVKELEPFTYTNVFQHIQAGKAAEARKLLAAIPPLKQRQLEHAYAQLYADVLSGDSAEKSERSYDAVLEIEEKRHHSLDKTCHLELISVAHHLQYRLDAAETMLRYCQKVFASIRSGTSQYAQDSHILLLILEGKKEEALSLYQKRAGNGRYYVKNLLLELDYRFKDDPAYQKGLRVYKQMVDSKKASVQQLIDDFKAGRIE